MKFLLSALFAAITLTSAAQNLLPRDSIMLSDPAILVNAADSTYYMTGTGGRLWKSRDLKMWEGPYNVVEVDTASWMGPRPQIWAAELQKDGDKYYCFATFTNPAIIIDEAFGEKIPRRASHILKSDKPDGPYRPFGADEYTDASKPTLDGTFWRDADGRPYLVYCHEWIQNHDGTIEAVELKEDLSGPAGEPFLLFRASSCPWSREDTDDGSEQPNMVTDGPWLFRTATGRLGMIWTSWIGSRYTQGVAYSESSTLRGPWVHEPEPITPPDFGHGMLFRDLNGRWLMSVHSHRNVKGRYIRHPQLFEVDLSGDRLIVGRQLK